MGRFREDNATNILKLVDQLSSRDQVSPLLPEVSETFKDWIILEISLFYHAIFIFLLSVVLYLGIIGLMAILRHRQFTWFYGLHKPLRIFELFV